jgi:DNA end-binding protein Ku
VVQVRPAEDGLVLQQLLYADEVRSLKDLDIEKVTVSSGELNLALQFIEQISQDGYDPAQFEDEEKKRILASIDQKISGKQIVAMETAEAPAGAQVIDLVEALRASLAQRAGKAKPAKTAGAEEAAPAEAEARKGVRRAQKAKESAPPARTRARK